MNGMVTCPNCKGSGQIINDELLHRQVENIILYEDPENFDVQFVIRNSNISLNQIKLLQDEALNNDLDIYDTDLFTQILDIFRKTEDEFFMSECDLCKGTGEVDWVTSIMFNGKET